MREKRPSAAMVVAIIALVFALAGTGAASVATISALTHKEKSQTRNIADGEVNKLAPGLSVKSAGSATAAATADRASSAANASLVNGHDASCPPTSFLYGGLCFDNAPRTADFWGNASDACASAGGMLPTVDQLRPTRLLPGVDLGVNSASGEWASDFAANGAGFSVISVDDNGGVTASTNPFGVPTHPFRCVFLLVR